MAMNISTMLVNVGIYLGIISALALATERIMDAIKFFAKKYLAREQRAQQSEPSRSWRVDGTPMTEATAP